MRENLSISLKWTLAYEGGYVNHKDDPGGATNKGITQRVYDAYRRRLGQAPQSVRLITNDEVAQIYKDQYWDRVRADDLPTGVDFAVWDYAVNSGVKQAAKDLQRVVGVRVDGVIGELTLAAVEKYDPVDIVTRLCERRLALCKTLKNRKTGKKLWPIFGKGWQRRIMGEIDGLQTHDIGVIDRAVAMMTPEIKNEDVPMPVAPAPGKAEQLDRDSLIESKSVLANVAQGLVTSGGGITLLQSLERDERILLIGFVCVSVLLTGFLLRERIKAWADGWR